MKKKTGALTENHLNLALGITKRAAITLGIRLESWPMDSTTSATHLLFNNLACLCVVTVALWPTSSHHSVPLMQAL